MKKWKIIWSPLALTRINEETKHIARDKPGAAEKWADGIFEFETIDHATNQEIGRRPRWVSDSTRPET